MRFALDTGVLNLFYAGDARVSPYFRQVMEGRAEGLLMSVTLAEFFYKVCQKLGKEIATLRYNQCRSFLRIIETDEGLSLNAGLEKCHTSALSLADSFLLALAKDTKATILTTDEQLARCEDVKARFFEV